MNNMELQDIFNYFNNNSFNYYILRDYASMERIYNSKDIDLFIAKEDLKKANKFLVEKNWNKQVNNTNKYPHIQYVKIINNKLFKLDFVTDFYYGKNNYEINIDNGLRASNRNISGIKICNELLALITMTLHIVFDKENLNSKNHMVINQMKEDYLKVSNNYVSEPISKLLKITFLICEKDIGYTNKNILNYKREILELGIVKKNSLKSFIYNFRILINKIFRRIRLTICNNSIAFIGVDGSGKSSCISRINRIFNDNSIIQYMGLKEYSNKKIYKLEKSNRIIDKYIRRLLLYFEMLKRVYKNRFSTNITLFDRYSYDFYINSKGLFKIIDYIFYRVLFPKPKIIFYFYCNAETSLSRKDDIEDKEKFKIAKAKFDKFYLNKKNVFSIDTTENTVEDSTNILSEQINSCFLKRIL